MFGKNGKSNLTFLDSGRNDFERNQTDVFGLECDFLGELTKITIGHDNKGIGASWFLDKVEIFSERENKNCKKQFQNLFYFFQNLFYFF